MDPNQQQPASFSRPSARMAPPIQRGNYGVPTRPSKTVPAAAPVPQPPTPVTPPTPVQTSTPPVQPAASPAPSGPRYMDVTRPVAQAQQPTAAPVQTPAAPLFSTTPAASQPVTPLFTPQPVSAPTKPKSSSKQRMTRIAFIALVIVAGLLSIAGLARWATAGSTTGMTAAVGAVAANDGRTMTIQFTADDGKIHKFTAGSEAKLIPGTAVEVAFRPGAADASVVRVAVVKGNKNIGMSLFLAGVVLFAASGGVIGIKKLRQKSKQNPTSLTTPVTV